MVKDHVRERIFNHQLGLSEPGKIASIWEHHYSQLYANHTGHSRDMEYWKQFEVPLASGSTLPTEVECNDLNAPIQWREIREGGLFLGGLFLAPSHGVHCLVLSEGGELRIDRKLRQG